MEFRKKLLMACSILAIAGVKNAHAEESYDPYTLKPNLSRGFSLDWNASGNLDTDVSKLKDFNDLGEKIKVRDLRFSTDALVSIFGARLTLEDPYEDQLKVDASDIQSKVKDLYIGVQPLTNTVILFGRKEIPFGADVSRRAVDINDSLHQLNKANERYMVASVQVSPQMIDDLLKITQGTSIEVSAFNSNKNDQIRLKDAKDLDSYSARVKTQLGRILGQASYMKIHNGGHQASVSAQAGAGCLMDHCFNVYGELRAIRASTDYGDSNVTTVGTETDLWKGKVFVEGSRVQVKKAGAMFDKTKNEATIGYKQRLNSYMDAGIEYTTNVKDKKDTTVMATMLVHKKDTSSQAPSLFSNLKKKD